MTRKGILALSVLLTFFAGWALADSGSSGISPTAKISSELRAKVASEGPQDLIVVFDDTAVQQEAGVLRRALRATLNDQTVLDLTASRLADTKGQVLSRFASEEIVALREFSHLPVGHLRVQSGVALDKLLALPGVVHVYENKVRYRAGLAQSLPLVEQPRAAAAGNRGVGTTVAVLDQRVDFSNAAFGPCTSPGVPSNCKVLVAQDAPGMLNDGLGYQDQHGTNVAATALAVAPGSNLVALNVFNGVNANDSDIISAINWCVANASRYNIVAMNLSLGAGGDTAPTTASPYYSAFATARATGILPVVAAGNEGYANKISSPGSVVGAVSVGAVYDSAYGFRSFSKCSDQTTAADQVTCFSNSASFLTLFGPGCSDDAAGVAMCGTSQAAPHVAGAVAVLRSAFPSDTLDQTVSRLQGGPPVTDVRNDVTKPRLDLARSLALSTCSYSVSPTTASISNAGTSANSASVVTGTGCTWSASSDVGWIVISDGSSRSSSGNFQYFVPPNNSTTARTGTIAVAGKTITVTQAAAPSQSDIQFYGTYAYETAGHFSSVTLSVEEIENLSTQLTTGTLRLELWLSDEPFSLQGGTGWLIAKYQIGGASNGTLAPGERYSNTSGSVPLANLPVPGGYYANFVLSEYAGASCSSPDQFCLVDVGNFSNKFYVPDITDPTVPMGLSAAALSASQVKLSWTAASDNVAVSAYEVFQDGTLLGRVTTSGAMVSGLTPGTTSQFTVSACDSAENCSAKSAPASATTLPAGSVIPESGLWAIDSEAGQSGRGFQVEVRNGTLVFTYYGYLAGGSGMWGLAAGPINGAYFSSGLNQYRGGSVLGGAYSPATSAGSVGTVTISFTSATTGTITLPGESPKSISKFSFGGTTVPTVVPVDGLWSVDAENTGQSGRGFQIEQHAGVVVLTYYGYGLDGSSLWALSAGIMDGNSFVAEMNRYQGGTPLGGSFVPATSSGSVGAVTVNFTSPTTGTITFPGETPKAISKFMW